MFTQSKANLALTLTKLVLKPKDMISMLLDGLEVFFNVYGVSLVSSNLRMAEEHIYIALQLELAV